MNRQPWMDDAECLNHDPEIWFPERRNQSDTAIKICRTCPVLNDCANWAKTNPYATKYGVWAARPPQKT